MAREDTRNRRKSKTTTKTRTRVVDGGSSTQSVYGSRWDSSSVEGSQDAFVDLEGDIIARRTGADTWETKNGRTATAEKDKYFGGYSGDKLNITVDNPDKRVSSSYKQTTLSAKDRFGESGKDSDQKKLKTKKEGRSKLRIQASGDSSAARLKGGPNSGREKNKLKIDVQSSGGKAGLNVPR